MRRPIAILAVALCLSAVAQAQERKIEISPFAGGYFSAGFQSYENIQLVPTLSLTKYTPVNEPNSGIFGVRATYELTPRITLEGTFGFSPAGRRGLPTGIYFFDIGSFLGGASDTTLPTVVVRGNDTFHYAGSVLFPLRRVHGWTPFLAGGAGAVTRTAETHLLPPTNPAGLPPNTFIYSLSAPSPTETNLSLNLGGGVKKYFSDRCGIRFDFRSYISKVSGDMVNNMEVSFGLIFKL